MKRGRGRPGPEAERLNIKMIASSATASEAYIVSLTAERDRLREMVREVLDIGAAHRAAAAEVSDILERILERGYIDAPANAAAVAALKRQGAANRRQAREMRAAGRKVREIMKRMDLSERQVYRLLKKD